MTLPRQVLPGTTCLVTRRCGQRSFFLRPAQLSDQIFKYVLAVAANRYRIALHDACVLSDHYHLVLTDPHARLPEFSQYLDSLVARALNALHGRRESFWAPASYSAVSLEQPADVLEKSAYTLANPAAAGLVERASEWPGIWTDPSSIGGPAEVIHRPDFFFSKKGNMPKKAELKLTVPPGWDSPEEFRAALRQRVTELEVAAAAKRAAKGWGVLGAALVLAQSPTQCATSFEPLRTLNPRIAAQDTQTRVDAIRRLSWFRTRYREALEQLRKGIAEVLFPPGTYWLRVHLNVACAAT